jgi:hypothetical protein
MTSHPSVALVLHSLHTPAEICERLLSGTLLKNKTCSLRVELPDQRPVLAPSLARTELLLLMRVLRLLCRHLFVAPVLDLHSLVILARQVAVQHRLTPTVHQQVVRVPTPRARSSKLQTTVAVTPLVATHLATKPRLHVQPRQTQHTLVPVALWVLLIAVLRAVAAETLVARWHCNLLLLEMLMPEANSDPADRRAPTMLMAPRVGAASNWRPGIAARAKALSAR